MINFNLFKENGTFIMGHIRSGTTFLRTLFDHHPQLVVFPVESHFFRWVDSEDKVNDFLKNTSFEKYCKNYYNVDISDVKDRLRGRFKKTNSRKNVLLSLIETYYEIENSEKKDKQRWVEKTPSHLYSIPMFKKWFGKNVKVIYIYRDPRDIFTSVRKKYPSTTLRDVCSTYDLSYRLHTFYREYRDWFFSVKYEDLLNDPEETLKGLCRFLNIEFDNILLRPTINGKPFMGNSRFGEMFFSLSKDPIGRYANYLTEGEISFIETFLNKPMRDYGYIRNKPKKIENKIKYYTFLLWQEIKFFMHKIKWRMISKR